MQNFNEAIDPTQIWLSINLTANGNKMKRLREQVSRDNTLSACSNKYSTGLWHQKSAFIALQEYSLVNMR